MGHWRRQAERWLSSEEPTGPGSEELLGQVFAAFQPIQPSRDFVRCAVEAAWQARARRRRVTTALAVAASILMALSAVLAYAVLGDASSWLIASIASAATRPAGLIVAASATAIEWWADMTRLSGVLAGVVAMPQNTLALVAVEVAAGGALYALHRLLRGDGVRHPGPLCL